MVPEQYPTTSHASFQYIVVVSFRSGLNADWAQKRLAGKLLHSKTIASLDTLSPGVNSRTESLYSEGHPPTKGNPAVIAAVGGAAGLVGALVGLDVAICTTTSLATIGGKTNAAWVIELVQQPAQQLLLTFWVNRVWKAPPLWSCAWKFWLIAETTLFTWVG